MFLHPPEQVPEQDLWQELAQLAEQLLPQPEQPLEVEPPVQEVQLVAEVAPPVQDVQLVVAVALPVHVVQLGGVQMPPCSPSTQL